MEVLYEVVPYGPSDMDAVVEICFFRILTSPFNFLFFLFMSDLEAKLILKHVRDKKNKR